MSIYRQASYFTKILLIALELSIFIIHINKMSYLNNNAHRLYFFNNLLFSIVFTVQAILAIILTFFISIRAIYYKVNSKLKLTNILTISALSILWITTITNYIIDIYVVKVKNISDEDIKIVEKYKLINLIFFIIMTIANICDVITNIYLMKIHDLEIKNSPLNFNFYYEEDNAKIISKEIYEVIIKIAKNPKDNKLLERHQSLLGEVKRQSSINTNNTNNRETANNINDVILIDKDTNTPYSEISNNGNSNNNDLINIKSYKDQFKNSINDNDNNDKGFTMSFDNDRDMYDFNSNNNNNNNNNNNMQYNSSRHTTLSQKDNSFIKNKNKPDFTYNSYNRNNAYHKINTDIDLSGKNKSDKSNFSNNTNNSNVSNNNNNSNSNNLVLKETSNNNNIISNNNNKDNKFTTENRNNSGSTKHSNTNSLKEPLI